MDTKSGKQYIKELLQMTMKLGSLRTTVKPTICGFDIGGFAYLRIFGEIN